jgi:hypothetical protein
MLQGIDLPTGEISFGRQGWRVRILPGAPNFRSNQALAAAAAGACFSGSRVWKFLRDHASQTLFAASIRFANSAAKFCVVMRPER